GEKSHVADPALRQRHHSNRFGRADAEDLSLSGLDSDRGREAAVIAAGTRLGPYEVLEPLGAGGMGEVYRARDARLGREVAIKVLPAAVAVDQERLKRFEKEARSASSLNHPNIVTIYDIGSENGVSYIAMEQVEGATLRELLADGPMQIRKLLPIATQ